MSYFNKGKYRRPEREKYTEDKTWVPVDIMFMRQSLPGISLVFFIVKLNLNDMPNDINVFYVYLLLSIFIFFSTITTIFVGLWKIKRDCCVSSK